MAKKDSKVTVTMTSAAGGVYVWHAKRVNIDHLRDSAKLEVIESDEAGTFTIQIPVGATVEVTP